jgi:hypothetical protein
MSVRVWMKPSDLGDQAYFIVFAEADGYEVIADQTLLMYAGKTQVAIVAPDRWEAAEVVSSDVGPG